MYVEIDNRYPRQTALECMGRGNSYVVEKTEPHCPCAFSMMSRRPDRTKRQACSPRRPGVRSTPGAGTAT